MSELVETFLHALNEESLQTPERLQELAELVGRIVELAKYDTDVADLRLASISLQELLEASIVFAPWRERRKITVFGSARTSPSDVLYEMARQFGEATAAQGWMTVSGAGPGIMEASSRGSGRANTLGVNIELPFEQGANDFIDVNDMHVAMKFFFTRKVALTRASQAFVAFPGGVGTMDEIFEILTLVHTGKTNPAPIVLVDSPEGSFWHRWFEFMEVLARDGYIDHDDLCLVDLHTSVESAIASIEGFYRNYRDFQVEGRRARVRLQHLPNPGQLASLKEQFPTFCFAEGFVVGDDALWFDFDGRNYVKLRQLINVVNDWIV